MTSTTKSQIMIDSMIAAAGALIAANLQTILGIVTGLIVMATAIMRLVVEYRAFKKSGGAENKPTA